MPTVKFISTHHIQASVFPQKNEAHCSVNVIYKYMLVVDHILLLAGTCVRLTFITAVIYFSFEFPDIDVRVAGCLEA